MKKIYDIAVDPIKIAYNLSYLYRVLIMTAFAAADLPTGARAITTVEQLNAWTTQILLVNNAKEKFVSKSGEASENCIQYRDGADADSTQRVITFCVFEFDMTTFGTGVADWKQVKEIGTAAIPTSMKG